MSTLHNDSLKVLVSIAAAVFMNVAIVAAGMAAIWAL